MIGSLKFDMMSRTWDGKAEKKASLVLEIESDEDWGKSEECEGSEEARDKEKTWKGTLSWIREQTGRLGKEKGRDSGLSSLES